jgi:hypothetical protein
MAKKAQTRIRRQALRKLSGSSASETSTGQRESRIKSSRNIIDRKPNITSLINRDIFRDPFFSEWEDLFNIPSFDEMAHKTEEMAKKAMKGADRMTRNIDTTHPGSYTSRSFYRTTSTGTGIEPRREVISQESSTNVDEKGHKFTEKWKTLEKDNVKKTSHAKLIDDRGVKEMRTHNYETGEEYLHTDYKKINEKEINNFNNEFERGLRNVKGLIPSLPTPILRNVPSLSSWGGFPSLLERDPFMNMGFGFHDRMGLPSYSNYDREFGFRRPEIEGSSRPLSAASEQTDIPSKRGSK